MVTCLGPHPTNMFSYFWSTVAQSIIYYSVIDSFYVHQVIAVTAINGAAQFQS